MTGVQNKNTEKNYKTDEKSLMQEIKAMFDNYFICDIAEDGNSLIIALKNCQKFSLHIKEIA